MPSPMVPAQGKRAVVCCHLERKRLQYKSCVSILHRGWGVAALRMSLPYHEQFASPTRFNVRVRPFTRISRRTLDAASQGVIDLMLPRWLECELMAKGTRVKKYGTSLGSCYAFSAPHPRAAASTSRLQSRFHLFFRRRTGRANPRAISREAWRPSISSDQLRA